MVGVESIREVLKALEASLRLRVVPAADLAPIAARLRAAIAREGTTVPVACDVIAPNGRVVAARVDIEYADALLRKYKWEDCHKGNFLYDHARPVPRIRASRTAPRKARGGA